ncbi:hypothetical protein HY989_01875 [Candidatus Micrarchaeota archaeon]|nr:hypothetical protein [Candidatus Micrarchaeota archaeon]
MRLTFILFLAIIALILMRPAQAIDVSACQTLGTSGATYNLIADLSIPSGTCFTISAQNVDFNLNGHKLTFSGPAITAVRMDSSASGSKVHNGIITETGSLSVGGDGTGALKMSCTNCRAYDMEIHTASYHFPAIEIRGPNSIVEIYNLKIYINATNLVNDDINVGGINAYEMSSVTSMSIHDNFIRGRAWLINTRGTGFANIYNNVLVPIKYGRNPYAVRYGALAGTIFNNTMVSTNCRGTLVENGKNLVIANNYFDCGETVYSGIDGSGPHTLRIRGTDANTNNFSIYGNTFIARALAGSGAITAEGALIGNWQNMRIYDNIFMAYSDYAGVEGGALAIEGTLDSSTYIYNNILRSNFEGLRLGHSNVGTSNGIFDSLTFIKETAPTPLTYHSISNFPTRFSNNETFRNFTYQNGAQKSDLLLGRTGGAYSYTFEWYLTIRIVDGSGNPLGGAAVSITNSFGNVFSGTTGADGKINNLPLKELTASSSAATIQYSPYTVAVTYGGSTQTRSVTLDSTKTETFTFGGGAPDTIPPGAIVLANPTSPTSSSLTVSWTATGDDGNTGIAQSYDLRYSTSPINSGNFDSAFQASGEPAPAASGTVQSMPVTGLLSSTTYYFAIKAIDDASNTGAISNVVSGTTSAPADTTPPVRSSGAPSGTLATDTTSTTMTLTTNEPATCRYSLTPGTSYASMTSANNFATTGGTTHSQPITSLVNGGSYNRYIRCSDAAGNANTNDFTISFTVAADTTAPSAISNLAAPSSTTGSVSLTWTAVGDNGNTGTVSAYDVRVSTTTIDASNFATAFQYVATSPTIGAAGAAQSLTVGGLNPSTTYFFAIKARDEANNWGAISNVASRATSAAPDTSAPSIGNGQPAGTLGYTATQTLMNVTTNENANCKYSLVANQTYASMTNLFASTGATLHSVLITGLSAGQSYSYFVRCIDFASTPNANNADFIINFQVAQTPAPDSTPPLRSNGQPTGILPSGTSSTTISLATDENATCKFGTVSGTAYNLILNNFTATGGMAHSATVGNLSTNATYNYFVRCQDMMNNQNPDDFSISFGIGSTCVESWACSAWSACSSSGSQTRSCADANSCGTTASKPAESQGCTPPPTNTGGSAGSPYNPPQGTPTVTVTPRPSALVSAVVSISPTPIPNVKVIDLIDEVENNLNTNDVPKEDAAAVQRMVDEAKVLEKDGKTNEAKILLEKARNRLKVLTDSARNAKAGISWIFAAILAVIVLSAALIYYHGTHKKIVKMQALPLDKMVSEVKAQSSPDASATATIENKQIDEKQFIR